MGCAPESLKSMYATIYCGTSKKVKEALKKVEDVNLSTDELGTLTILINLKKMITESQGNIVYLTDRRQSDGEKKH